MSVEITLEEGFVPPSQYPRLYQAASDPALYSVVASDSMMFTVNHGRISNIAKEDNIEQKLLGGRYWKRVYGTVKIEAMR